MNKDISRRRLLVSTAAGFISSRLDRVIQASEPVLEVDNLTYYRYVRDAVLGHMGSFEHHHVAPLVRQIVIDSGLDSKVDTRIPVEGHYGSPLKSLRQLFLDMKMLEIHPPSRTSEDIEKLLEIYDTEKHPIFVSKQIDKATKDSVPSDLKQRTIAFPNDPLILAAKSIRDTLSLCDNLGKIMGKIGQFELGSSLFALAYQIDLRSDLDTWDPVATCLASEKYVRPIKNVFVHSRRKLHEKIVWKVDTEVEAKGKEVIDSYNKYFKDHGRDAIISNLTRDNIHNQYELKNDMLRVLQLTEDSRGNTYHWAIVDQVSLKSRGKSLPGYAYRVIDFLGIKKVTTKEWRADSQMRASYRNQFDIKRYRDRRSSK